MLSVLSLTRRNTTVATYCLVFPDLFACRITISNTSSNEYKYNIARRYGINSLRYVDEAVA